MDTIKPRLVNCFQTVFPALPEQDIPTATQATVEAWDSIAAITLVGVIEDEFGIQMEMDALADLDSFPRIHEYVAAGLPS